MKERSVSPSLILSARTFCCVAMVFVSTAAFGQSNKPAKSDQGAAQSSSNTASRRTDKRIEQAIQARLEADPDVAAHLIDIESNDGVVTLKGTVDDLLASERAERIARATRGVLVVMNELHARPVPREDSKIRYDIERALLLDPAADSYEVRIAVTNGVVTLTGHVDSLPERDIAENLAKSVRGVSEVKDQLIVDFDRDRIPLEIASDIRSRLENDARLVGDKLEVNVRDNVAYLSGSVRSALDKTLATNDAWVAGVRWVDTTDVTVTSKAPPERRASQLTSAGASSEQSSGSAASTGTSSDQQASQKEKATTLSNQKGDEAIAQAVRDAFLYDPRVLSFNPEIEVTDGMVTLSGTVDNAKAKRSAARDARRIVGVKGVRNYLKVRNAQQPTDAAIRKNVRDALVRTVRLNDDEINISVVNGKVYLSGTVDSMWERSFAEDVAMGIKGVLDVGNYLTVPVYDNGHSSGYRWYGYPDNWSLNLHDDYGYEPSTDFDLQKDVEDQMFWSPFVDADEVQVSVDDGVVTLSGTVETPSERRAAAKNAYDAGALMVQNDLAVTYESDPLF